MNLSENLLAELERVIHERFDAGSVRDVSVKSVEVDEDEEVIRIILHVTHRADPALMASNYLGLTGTVRKALGSEWRGFFPVITPQLGREACA